MFDFRLQVFHIVAKRLNFTRAAEELFITQPAVTKHIQEIESHFKVKLFERNGTKTKLTAAGSMLLQYTDRLFSIYSHLEFDMNALTQRLRGKLRIGASTTVAQYVLPPVLAGFHRKFIDIEVVLSISNTEQIEQALINKEIDLGIVEGHSKNPVLKYAEFIRDELVLVGNTGNRITKETSIKPAELTRLPLLLREPGSGTLQVIAHALKSANLKISDLKTEMQLASTESIKSYLLHADCFAFLSIHSILKELQNKELAVIEIKGIAMDRMFYFIQEHGQPETLPELFMKFARHYNFR